MTKFVTQNVHDALAKVQQWQVGVSEELDGLTVVPPGAPANSFLEASIPERLLLWLEDLRLLRHVPLAYLVPDPALLPPESIRFFHVDQTWTDRLIDGVLSAGNIGTVDMTFQLATLAKIRELLDARLGVTNRRMTGMLIRSELVERWPDLIVRAKPSSIDVIRKDTVSNSIMIVLFAGVPTEVQIREPDVGLRFGVEKKGSVYKVDKHDNTGETIVDPGASPSDTDDKAEKFTVRLCTRKVLDVANLKKQIDDDPRPRMNPLPGDPTRSRDVALNLRQLPYVARFKQDVDAQTGSEHKTAAGRGVLKLRKGRQVPISTVLARRGRQTEGGE